MTGPNNKTMKQTYIKLFEDWDPEEDWESPDEQDLKSSGLFFPNLKNTVELEIVGSTATLWGRLWSLDPIVDDKLVAEIDYVKDGPTWDEWAEYKEAWKKAESAGFKFIWDAESSELFSVDTQPDDMMHLYAIEPINLDLRAALELD